MFYFGWRKNYYDLSGLTESFTQLTDSLFVLLERKVV